MEDLSTTIKIHHLITHTDTPVLEKYHTFGFFAEYALESIYHLVNMYCRKFAQIDGDWRGKQVLRSLQFQKQDIHLTKTKGEKEDKKLKSRANRKKQGMGTAERIVKDNISTNMLQNIMHAHPITKYDEYLSNSSCGNLINCKNCYDALNNNVLVPEKLMHLNLCAHVKSKKKFKKN